MSRLHPIQRTADLWGIPLPVSGVLRSPGAECVPEQSSSCRHAACHRALSRQSWAGQGIGVRGPGIDETPLSYAEVEHGLREHLL